MSLASTFKAAATGAALLGSASGGVYVLEDRYEHQSDAKVTEQKVAEVDKDLEVHIITEQIDVKQDRIYKYEDRLEEHPGDTEAKQRIRELNEEKKHLEIELDKLKKE